MLDLGLQFSYLHCATVAFKFPSGYQGPVMMLNMYIMHGFKGVEQSGNT